MSEPAPLSAERIADLIAQTRHAPSHWRCAEGTDMTIGELRTALQSRARLVEAERLLDERKDYMRGVKCTVVRSGAYSETAQPRTCKCWNCRVRAFLSRATATEEPALQPSQTSRGVQGSDRRAEVTTDERRQVSRLRDHRP